MNKIPTHYGNLKVARDSPDFVIRAAYKALCQKYHPDKNPGNAHAARIMTIINQSYEVLSDPERRRMHDVWIAQKEAETRQWQEGSSPPQPTSTPPAPPPPSGSSCEGHAEGASHDHATPKESIQAKSFGERVRQYCSGAWRWLMQFMREAFVAAPGLTSLFVLILLVCAWTFLGSFLLPNHSKPYQADPQIASASEPETRTPNASDTGPDCHIIVPGSCGISSAMTGTASAQMPSSGNSKVEHAPNGNPWPRRAGYVKGYPIANTRGYSEVTVDNAGIDSDVFVKLVSLDGATAHPVRQFYIPHGSKFKMETVKAGTYDLRYRDLDSGALSRSQSFEVVERRSGRNIEYSNMSITLQKSQGGNFQTYALGEDEF